MLQVPESTPRRLSAVRVKSLLMNRSRTSRLGSIPFHKIVYENTYRMEPEKKFHSNQARAIAVKVVERYIKPDEPYEGEEAGVLARIIAADVNKALKALNCKRYKYVTQVTIGQKNKQGLCFASQMLSFGDTDTYAEYVFENKGFFCVVLVFAFYKE